MLKYVNRGMDKRFYPGHCQLVHPGARISPSKPFRAAFLTGEAVGRDEALSLDERYRNVTSSWPYGSCLEELVGLLDRKAEALAG